MQLEIYQMLPVELLDLPDYEKIDGVFVNVNRVAHLVTFGRFHVAFNIPNV